MVEPAFNLNYYPQKNKAVWLQEMDGEGRLCPFLGN